MQINFKYIEVFFTVKIVSIMLVAVQLFMISACNSESYDAPYSESDVVADLTWAPAETVIRKADGSDTWPITWADDGLLYSAFADGWGFEPMIPEKLSMGFTKIKANPPNFQGVNIRSGGEQYGDGRKGKKASGMLMVDKILYMWVRNVDDGKYSQLAWSKDYGKTWSWAEWVFTDFGYCTFINFGKNYESARDNFVYIVTHDHPDAYTPADHFVLMRVPKDRIVERSAYEFFNKMDGEGNPIWTSEIGQRKAVFKKPGRSLRSGISYNLSLGRYFWWQQDPTTGENGGIDTRFKGGFGIYDAPEPWGPWTTTYSTEKWDMGPGETGSFPVKWMSEDGKDMYLVFSGNDCFSVRKATLTLSDGAD